MWSKLVDDKGRARASIFYKATFYDRRARIKLLCRFGIAADSEGEYNGDPKQRAFAVVTDCGKEVWRSPEPFSHMGTPGPGDAWSTYRSAHDCAIEAAIAHLVESYPGWQDPTKYWDVL